MERHKPEPRAVEAIVSDRGFDGKQSREKLDKNGKKESVEITDDGKTEVYDLMKFRRTSQINQL